jgi:hypothetical protein
MNEMAGVRKELRKALGQDLPEGVWAAEYIQSTAQEYLSLKTDAEREEAWGALEDGAKERLAIWNDGRKEGLRGVRSGTVGGSRDMREATLRDSGGAVGLDAGWSVGDRTTAMVGAMSALFALIGDQIPEVKEFRNRILPGRFVSAGEAHALIASYAARTLSPRWFEEWSIPFVDHRAEILDTGPRGADFSPVDDWMTIWVDPPGITKTVRYAYPQGSAPNTRCSMQSGAVIPIHTNFPIESHGDAVYPPWLWPGSLVDELYDLSVDLAGAFDWPLAFGNLVGTRPRSESAAWFILTGEAPPVRSIDARWEAKHGSTHLNPQWRIRLTIPPWLPEEEVLRALRLLRKQMPKGRKLPKTARPLEVARFVWERERLDGYHEPPPWKSWFEQWNELHPGHRFPNYNNFREYFVRGDAAIKELNFSWPEPRFQSSEAN